MSVVDLFEHMINYPSEFLNANSGQEFEDRIMQFLRNRITYNRIQLGDIPEINDLKLKILEHSNSEFIFNPTKNDKMFIYQPYGSQQYPDFLIFEGNYIFPVEAKFSKSGKRPVWNSGLPRPNGIYIYGALEHKKIVVFSGIDIVSVEESIKLHEFFLKLKELENEFNFSNMSEQRYGFVVYSRKAFEQSKKVNSEAQLSLVDHAKELGEKLLRRLKSLEA